MIATQKNMLQFLKAAPQFAIPIYQRTYSWTEKECRQLWDDILRAGSNDKVNAHFVGSIVYVHDGIYQVSKPSPLLVIDGQQRLTTVTLLVAALADAVGEGEPVEDFSAAKLRGYYLQNPLETGERRFKLVLSQTDKASLMAIVAGNEQPKEHSIRVVQNYELFKHWLEENKNDLGPVCRGLQKLLVVDVALSRDQDNPQLIFESMNSTGRELSQADLIRNFVLMSLDKDLQERLYEQYWRPMEIDFGQEAYTTHFDGFMRHFLTLKTGDIPNQREVYAAFKAFTQDEEVAKAGIENLVKEVRNHARYFCAMALKGESDPELRDAFADLRELKVDVAYPFLLHLYSDYAAGVLSQPDFVQIVRMIESYVFRRAVCGLPTNSMNKTFAEFPRKVKKDRYVESVMAYFLSLGSYRSFPRDAAFHEKIQTRDLYHFGNKTAYWLRRFENAGRKERVDVQEYTVEHILPQNENLSAAWQTALGPDWKRTQELWLHTLGNLTLTRYNSEYHDRPFAEKRDMTGGFRESPLKLNQGLGQLAQWNEQTIKERAQRLATQALDIWKAPQLAADVVATYRPKSNSPASYSIADHPFLQKSPLRELYEAFRREVLALDPSITEEFLKLYVAYKAETNFVDVVPRAKQLQLILNMKFSEIEDPKGMCKDVASLGRHGNGEVEVRLNNRDELPYVMGLVRQSFESQMGNGGE